VNNERKNEILTLIKKDKEVRLSDLTKLFPYVSEMTLRRDLDFLANKGLILRTHGGGKEIKATPIIDAFNFENRVTNNIVAKNNIASCAVKLLEENRSIYLDAGSTLLAFAEQIPDICLFIVTNAPNIGIEVAKRNNTEIVFLGGSMNKSALSVTGSLTSDNLDKINIDIAFMAAGGFSMENGFTNAYINECELKRKVIKLAKKVYVLLDQSKLGRNLPFTFANLEDVDAIITDHKLPEKLHDSITSKGIDVFVSK